MAATNRVQLVDLITQGVFDQLEESFPRRTNINYEEIARRCGVGITSPATSGGPYPDKPAEFETKFGEEFVKIVNATLVWLVRSDYLHMNDPQKGFANTYTLSERGAQLQGCIPASLRIRP